MENYLVITALGEDHPGIIQVLSELVLDSNCNITESRMSVLGGEFAVLMMVSGRWNELTKLEDALHAQAASLGLTITCKRTRTRLPAPDLMPYIVEAITVDHPGIVFRMADFFAGRNINIQELSTTCYAAAHTGTPMFALHMTTNIPANIHLATLRDEFLDFCEAENIDATIEPMKP